MQDVLKTDVVIVGAGPAGLAMAIELASGSDKQVYVLEKAQAVGNHIISGCVMDPSALDQLLPSWKDEFSEMCAVTKDLFYYLTKNRAIPLPHLPNASQKGCYVLSLSKLTRFLAKKAEQLGVEILCGYAATEMVYENNRVVGVRTGDHGLNKDGTKGPQYQPGIVINAECVALAEGAKGVIAEEVITRFKLRKQPMTYGLGVKEVWRVSPDVHIPGQVIHALGWPLTGDTYGGAFLYHGPDQKVFVGMIVGLDAPNPTMSPFQELQRVKHHPKWRHIFEEGEPIAYGARVINEGGYQSIPTLTFPGGMLIGCAAGFVNIVRIKGVHAAMHSGIEAAQSYLTNSDFNASFQKHAVVHDLYKSRNVRPSFKYGIYAGLLHTGLDQYLFRGFMPYTLPIQQDHKSVRAFKKDIQYPKPDGRISYPLLTMVQLSHTKHREDQPSHLVLKDESLPIKVNHNIYHSPECSYCPANVYEVVEQRFQINYTNCIHCKACAIRDPNLNIEWKLPEGGGGPGYSEL